MHQIYISYAPPDEAFALQLANDLRRNGPRVWLGIQQAERGEDWTARVEQALSEAQMMIVILSPAALEAAHVTAEWQTYLDINRPVFPVIALRCDPPAPLQARRPVDFTRDYRRAMHQLTVRLLDYRARTRSTRATGLAEKVQGFREEQKTPLADDGDPATQGIRRVVHGLYGRLRGG